MELSLHKVKSHRAKLLSQLEITSNPGPVDDPQRGCGGGDDAATQSQVSKGDSETHLAASGVKYDAGGQGDINSVDDGGSENDSVGKAEQNTETNSMSKSETTFEYTSEWDDGRDDASSVQQRCKAEPKQPDDVFESRHGIDIVSTSLKDHDEAERNQDDIPDETSHADDKDPNPPSPIQVVEQQPKGLDGPRLEAPGGSHTGKMSCPFCLFTANNSSWMAKHLRRYREMNGVGVEQQARGGRAETKVRVSLEVSAEGVVRCSMFSTTS